MSGSELNEDVQASIHKIFDKLITKLNVKQNYKIDVITGAAKGEGYVAPIYRVTVTGEKANNENVTLNFIVKGAPQNEILRKQINFRGMCVTEVNFYKNVYPAMERFQRKRNVQEPFDNIVKCYMTKLEAPYEAIVLENMKFKGYELWSKYKRMPKDHFELVLPIYGKYHALSYALRDQEPTVFKELTESVGTSCKECLAPKEEWKEFGETVVRSEPARLLRDKGYADVAEAYLRACDEYDKWLVDFGDEENQSVIAHGDCWSNNMMFMNNDQDRKPEKVCLLDWQLQLVTTPVWDIGYFFFASARGNILKDMNKYLKLYYDSFAKFLKQLGSNPDELFSYSDFMEHWKKYGHRPLLVAIVVLKIILQNAEKMPSFENPETYSSYMLSENNINEDYNERIVDLILSAYENGILEY